MFGSREMFDLLPQNYIFVFCWFGSQLAPPAPRITLREHKALRVISSVCDEKYIIRRVLMSSFRFWKNFFDLNSPHWEFLVLLVINYFLIQNVEHWLLTGAGGKPSTWFPPEGLFEPSWMLNKSVILVFSMIYYPFVAKSTSLDASWWALSESERISLIWLHHTENSWFY